MFRPFLGTVISSLLGQVTASLIFSILRAFQFERELMMIGFDVFSFTFIVVKFENKFGLKKIGVKKDSK
jgi:hypothetical protein